MAGLCGDKQWSIAGKEECYSLVSHFSQGGGAEPPSTGLFATLAPGLFCEVGTSHCVFV